MYPQLNKGYSAAPTRENRKGCSFNMSYCKLTVGETTEDERRNLDSNPSTFKIQKKVAIPHIE